VIDTAKSFDYVVVVIGGALPLRAPIERLTHLQSFVVLVERQMLFTSDAHALCG
jgi:hypothetical protein